MTPSTTQEPRHTFGHAMLEHWSLDPNITYLNHGTVGAPPRRVQGAQRALMTEIELQPARFMLRELADVGEIPFHSVPRMRAAAAKVAEFVGARADDVAFVDNATTGCNSVLRSLRFAAGDELLVADHGYGAVTNTVRYVAERAGATVKVVELPYPGPSGTTPETIVAAIEAALSARTRLLVIDHVTSGSALVLPIAEIAARCRARGVLTLIDGAHAPGALPLDIPALGVDFYTGNLHKWAMAARSCALIWAAPQHQAELHPTVISWGYGRGMAAEFDLLGTRDPSASLTAPVGLEFMRDLGLEAMRTWNHRVVFDAARSFAERWQVAIPAPESMFGSMVTIPLPERFGTTPEAAQKLKDALLYDERIETQLHAFKGRLRLRLAAQVYNDAGDFDRLLAAIEKRG